MTKRGGHGKRGGRARKDGRRTTPYNTSDPLPPPSNNQSDPFRDQPDPISPFSDPSPTTITTDPQQATQEQTDTVFETDQESGHGTTHAKRGITCGKGARKVMKSSKKRLTVEFNFEMLRATCDNASSFVYECGYIVRNNCSLQYKEWRHIPIEVRVPLRHKLTTLFDIDVENKDICKVIDSSMGRVWRGYRAKLHDYFKEIGGLEDPTKAKMAPPVDISSKEDWEYLCNMWCEPKYLEIVEKKVVARKKRKLDTRNGSKSTIRYHIELGHDLDSSSGQLETWRLTHWDEEKGWRSTDAAVKYEEMMKLRNDHSVELMSDKAIIEKVLGRNSVRLSGWGRDPVVNGNSASTSKSSKRPTYDELVDKIEILEGKCAMMEQKLIENNIMPPSSTSGRSQDDTSECNNTQSAQSYGECRENIDGFNRME